ncbi:MAG TPA: GntR family transcriptional regulator [Pirellulales bacterium]|nr:GntR family transcriptional regulator [Pirellulales bacterium]
MTFQIDPASKLPIYRQLAQQIRESVARGKLRPGAQLPSVRELSRSLVVNPNTVARVYTELEREGVLRTRQGLGAFVAEPKAELTRKARAQRLRELLDQLLTEAVHLGFSSDEVLAAVAERAGQFQWITN